MNMLNVDFEIRKTDTSVNLAPNVTLQVKFFREYKLHPNTDIKEALTSVDDEMYKKWNIMSWVPMKGTVIERLLPMVEKFSSVHEYVYYMEHNFTILFYDYFNDLKANERDFILSHCPSLKNFHTLLKIANFGTRMSCELSDLQDIALNKSLKFFYVPSYHECESFRMTLRNIEWDNLAYRGTLEWKLSVDEIKSSKFLKVFKEMHDVFCRRRFRIIDSYIILKGAKYLTPLHMDTHQYPHVVFYKCMKGEAVIFNFSTFEGLLAHKDLMRNLHQCDSVLHSEQCTSVTQLKEGDSVLITPFSFHLFITVSDSIVFAVEGESSSILMKISTESNLIMGPDMNRLK